MYIKKTMYIYICKNINRVKDVEIIQFQFWTLKPWPGLTHAALARALRLDGQYDFGVVLPPSPPGWRSQQEIHVFLHVFHDDFRNYWIINQLVNWWMILFDFLMIGLSLRQQHWANHQSIIGFSLHVLWTTTSAAYLMVYNLTKTCLVQTIPTWLNVVNHGKPNHQGASFVPFHRSMSCFCGVYSIHICSSAKPAASSAGKQSCKSSMATGLVEPSLKTRLPLQFCERSVMGHPDLL